MLTPDPLISSLYGTTLAFSRSGQHLFVVEPDGISIVDRAQDRPVRLAIAGARAVAGFDDQLWIATADDQMIRAELGGRVLGQPCPLASSPRPALTPAPCGAAAAVWASSPRIALVDDLGHLARTELEDADAIVPVTGRRFVVARGTRLALPSGLVTQLLPHTRVLGGAVMTDGKSVTLLVAQGKNRHLVVVMLGTGQVAQRCAAPASEVRLAARRGIAIARLEARLLWAFDLRAGRELGAIALEEDAHDLAIDPDGRQLAIHGASGVAFRDLVELLRRPPVGREDHTVEVRSGDRPIEAAAEAAPPPVTVAAPAQPPAEDHKAEAPPPFRCPVLEALAPRTRPPANDREEARRQLAGELRSVSLWVLEAIAAAWDTRRLGYGNEGRHPYELEVGAILGLNAGFAADHVQAARDRSAEHARALASDPRWRASGTPIGALRDELGLGERALDVLMVIAAASLRGEIARLYGILANDASRPMVDELLVQQVLASRHDREDLALELDPRAPLVRLGIVHVAARRARPFAGLTLDPVIGDRLRAVAPDLGSATMIRSATCEPAALDLPRDALESACAALSRPATGPARIVVRGRIGSGRRTLLASLAGVAGRDLAVIDALALPRTAEEFVAELARSLRRAHLAGLVPCIVQLADATFGEHAGAELAAEVLRLHPGPIAIVASRDATVPFAAGHVEIELPVPGETARHDVWRRALAESGVEVSDVEMLAARYRIGPGLIRRAVAAASSAAAAGDASPAIEAFIRQSRDARLGRYARRVDRLASWSSVVLPPDILDSLRELIARVRHGRTVFETWGMRRMMATSRGLTALFQGPPGTGKTLVAGVIARELGLDLYQVDLSKVMSKWIGETERNLATIFDAAEDGQVVLLFDEADSLFAKRTQVRSSNDRYANLEVNYLLQRLDSFEGIAILTTNIGASIDQAFKRRLSFRLSFPFPDEETREQLWRAHLPPELPVAGPFTLDVLAHKYQLSGGYIRNACLRAAFLAAQDETPLHQRHLERAIALEFAELGKLSSSGAIES
jgi:hypothetical protein